MSELYDAQNEVSKEAIDEFHKWINANSVYGISMDLMVAANTEDEEKSIEEFRQRFLSGEKMSWDDVSELIGRVGDPRVTLMRTERLVSKV